MPGNPRKHSLCLLMSETHKKCQKLKELPNDSTALHKSNQNCTLNHRIINHRLVWAGRDLKDHLVPTPRYQQGLLPLNQILSVRQGKILNSAIARGYKRGLERNKQWVLLLSWGWKSEGIMHTNFGRCWAAYRKHIYIKDLIATLY